jgi:hypothetical protein
MKARFEWNKFLINILISFQNSQHKTMDGCVTSPAYASASTNGTTSKSQGNLSYHSPLPVVGFEPLKLG